MARDDDDRNTRERSYDRRDREVSRDWGYDRNRQARDYRERDSRDWGYGGRDYDRREPADTYSPRNYGYGGYDREAGGGIGDRRSLDDWTVEGQYTGRGPKGYRRSDERIKEEVSERLGRHGRIDASDIEVDVENGEVTLTGTVDSRPTKRLVEDVLESVAGIKDIHNRLRMQERRAGDQETAAGEAATITES